MKSWLFSVFVLLLACGCAGPQTLLLRVGLGPDISPPLLPEGKKVTVSLSPFSDIRGEKISLGTRTRYEGVVDTYAPEGDLSQAVTEAVETWLGKSGFTVTRIPSWDLTSISLKGFSTNLVIGGKIEKLTVETINRFAKTNTYATCILSVVIGRTHDSSVTTERVESSAENQSPFFSLESVEGTTSDALTQALTRALKKLP